MKCACCGRKKKIMESFENLGDGGDVCVECSDIMYKIHDAVTEKQNEVYKSLVAEINEYITKKKSTKEFQEWFLNNYLKRNNFENK